MLEVGQVRSHNELVAVCERYSKNEFKNPYAPDLFQEPDWEFM